MAWQGISGHDGVVEHFRRAQQRGRLAGSFLFVGPPGIGKRLFAFALAKAYLCKGRASDALDPCGLCDSCRLFSHEESPSGTLEATHPDLYFVQKPADKSWLPLELLIGDREHRGQAGLLYKIAQTPYFGHGKVAIIDDADYFRENGEASNALLKTLEEPPPDTLLILLGTASNKQLPTIQSRCKIIRFAPLPLPFLSSLLLSQGIVATQEQGLKLARRAGGSFEMAKELYDESNDVIRGILEKSLLQISLDSTALASKIIDHIDAAGKDAPLRRRRLKGVFLHVLDLFRSQMRQASLESPIREEVIRRFSKRLERTLEALEQIDRNAQLPFIVEAWCQNL